MSKSSRCHTWNKLKAFSLNTCPQVRRTQKVCIPFVSSCVTGHTNRPIMIVMSFKEYNVITFKCIPETWAVVSVFKVAFFSEAVVFGVGLISNTSLLIDLRCPNPFFFNSSRLCSNIPSPNKNSTNKVNIIVVTLYCTLTYLQQSSYCTVCPTHLPQYDPSKGLRLESKHATSVLLALVLYLCWVHQWGDYLRYLLKVVLNKPMKINI